VIPFFFLENLMAKKTNLPAEVRTHFTKANVLHGYVLKDLGEATKHALETGRELLAAKSTLPHGSWVSECERLFVGTLRTAQFYMQFTKHITALPKAQASALLMLEGTLEGVAKAAKEAAQPKAPEPEKASSSPPPPTKRGDSEPHSNPESLPEDWLDPYEAPEAPETPSEPDRSSESHEGEEVAASSAGEPRRGTDGKLPKQYDPSVWHKQWKQAMAPLVRLVDRIAQSNKNPQAQKDVQACLNAATEELVDWIGVEE
jgi:hypothetical protein